MEPPDIFYIRAGREMDFDAVDATSRVSSAGQCDKKSPSLPVPQLDICPCFFVLMRHASAHVPTTRAQNLQAVEFW
jgi:hypothetical protein